MERQLEALNGLPKNKDLFDKVFSTADTAGTGSSSEKRMVSELWQTVNMRRRVDANEEGLNRVRYLSSLGDLHDLTTVAMSTRVAFVSSDSELRPQLDKSSIELECK